MKYLESEKSIQLNKTRDTSSDSVPYIGAMLRVVSNWVRDQVYAGVREDGFDDLNPAHLALFRYPGLDGMRPSQMASELQMTKQGINQLTSHLEQHGYIRRETDPVDGRGRIIRLTAKGRRVETAVVERAREVEGRITKVLGARGSGRLRSELKSLFEEVTRSSGASEDKSGDTSSRTSRDE